MSGIYRNTDGEKVFIIDNPVFGQHIHSAQFDLSDIVEALADGESVTFEYGRNKYYRFSQLNGEKMYETEVENENHPLTAEDLKQFNSVFADWLSSTHFNSKQHCIEFIYEPL